VQHTLIASARARIRASASQVTALLVASAKQRVEQVATLASRPALTAALERPGPESRAAVLQELQPATDQPQTLAVELWSRDGRKISATYGSGVSASDRQLGVKPPEGPGLSPIRISKGTVYYETTVPVASETNASKPLGWLVERRSLDSSRSAQAITGLIGADARLLLGNVAGGAWTDLGGPAPPPSDTGPVAPGEVTVSRGEERLGFAAAVPGTPWLLWIDLPRETALHPARVFLRRLLGLSLSLLVVGVVATYLLSRRVSRPIDQLTSAAEGLAAGDLDRRVPVERRDEVGRLARAFDGMRTEVAEARHRLEDRVEERTHELRLALQQLRETQEELVQKERLAILGQLASGVGHELRNPLAVMTNAIYYLHLVLEDAGDEVLEYLGILQHQVGLSEKIVGDLLDFARIKAPQRQEVALETLVETELERIGLPAECRLERSFPSDLPPALADPVQIGQVVLNLLTNATQAIEASGGTLAVEGRRSADGGVELEVRDSGAGVPAELADRIFEPLFTTKARGIGLGLAVSRGLAEANGGLLLLADPPAGGGATFVLRLPSVREVAA
jgi:signal transduction histidine kinase